MNDNGRFGASCSNCWYAIERYPGNDGGELFLVTRRQALLGKIRQGSEPHCMVDCMVPVVVIFPISVNASAIVSNVAFVLGW